MHTVIRVFDDRAGAQRALETLVQAGFDRDDLHIEADVAGAGSVEVEDRGAASNFGHFVTSLLGQDEPTRGITYAEALRRGHCVLVMDARDEAEARRAAAMVR